MMHLMADLMVDFKVDFAVDLVVHLMAHLTVLEISVLLSINNLDFKVAITK